MAETGSVKKVVGYTSGDYGNETTQITQTNIGQVNHLLTAIENITTQPEKTFVICEYGASNGKNSFQPFHTVIGQLKKRKSSPEQFLLIYQDLPCNDFNSLFRVLEGKKEELAETERSWYSAVMSLACANTFHVQCVPDRSVHLGYSSSAMHWLSTVPCVTEDFPENWTSREVEEVWRKQAAEDWSKILELRGRELAPGGRLVLQMGGRNEHGEYSGSTRQVTTNIWQNLKNIYRQLMDEGLITSEEFKNTVKNFYVRTEEEFKVPFKDSSSAVRELNLCLDDIEYKTYRCVFNAKWTGGDSMGAEEMAESVKQYITFVRSWNEHTWYSSLSPARSQHERLKLVDELYSRYYKQVLGNPTAHGFDIVSCTVCISKSNPKQNIQNGTK